MALVPVAQSMGQIAAVGDHLQQLGNQRKHRNPWLKMLYQGIRSLISLMPNSYNVNIAVNEMRLDEEDKDLIEFSVSYVRAMEASGHIVWRDLGACLDLLGPTYSADRFIPDLSPKRNWTAADSVLHLFNDNKKETRHRSWAHEQWQDNQFVWGRYVTDSKWAIKDGGQIMDIVKALQEILEADDEVRGDPGNFQDHLSFLSA